MSGFSGYEVWLSQNPINEDYPEDIVIQLPCRDSKQLDEVFELLTSESIIQQVISNQGVEVWFDPELPLIALKVEFDNTRLASYVARKAIARDVEAPRLVAKDQQNAEASVRAFFRVGARKLEEHEDAVGGTEALIQITPPDDRGFATIKLIARSRESGTETQVARQFIFDVDVASLRRYVQARHFSMLGRRATIRTDD